MNFAKKIKIKKDHALFVNQAALALKHNSLSMGLITNN